MRHLLGFPGRRLVALLMSATLTSLTCLQALPAVAQADEAIIFIGKYFEKTPDGTTIKYLYAGDQLIAAVIKSPSGARSTQYFHKDHLGSTNVVTDQAGVVLARMEYRPFGTTSSQSGSANPAQKFTGQRLDDSTGLYYYGGRYYDAQLGRFIQPDRYVQNLADPQMLNRHSYARNNPVRYVDPSGHFVFLAALLFVAASAAVTGAIGAAVSVGVAAATGNIHNFGDFAKAAGKGFVAGAAAGGTGAVGALVMGPAIAGGLLGSVALGAGSGAVGGGVGSVLNGGSFGQGAGIGALTGGVFAGVGHAVGPYVAQTQFGQAAGRLTSPATSRLGNLYNQALAPRTTGFDGLLTRAQYGIQSGLARVNNAFYPGRPALSPTQTDSFTYGNPVARRSQEGYLWRAIGPGSDPNSPYFAAARPGSAAEAIQLYNPANRNLTHVQMYHRPAGITEYFGPVAGGEGMQIVIPNPGAMDVTPTGPPIPFDGE